MAELSAPGTVALICIEDLLWIYLVSVIGSSKVIIRASVITIYTGILSLCDMLIVELNT